MIKFLTWVLLTDRILSICNNLLLTAVLSLFLLLFLRILWEQLGLG